MHIKLKKFFIGHLDQLMNFYFKFLWGRCSILWQSPLNITVLGRACARRAEVELRSNSFGLIFTINANNLDSGYSSFQTAKLVNV